MWIFLGSSSLRVCFLDLNIHFLPQVRKVFHPLFLQISFSPFSLFSPSGTPIMQLLVCLILSQRLLKLSWILKTFFLLFALLIEWFSTILPSRSFIHSPVSSNLLLTPSSVFFTSIIIFFSSDSVFLKFSKSLLKFSLCFFILHPGSMQNFMTISLHSIR